MYPGRVWHIMWWAFLSTLLCDFFVAVGWVVVFGKYSRPMMRFVAADPPCMECAAEYDNMGYVGLFLGGLLAIAAISLVPMVIYVVVRIRKERREATARGERQSHGRP